MCDGEARVVYIILPSRVLAATRVCTVVHLRAELCIFAWICRPYQYRFSVQIAIHWLAFSLKSGELSNGFVPIVPMASWVREKATEESVDHAATYAQ